MKYRLTFYCDVCDAEGHGSLKPQGDLPYSPPDFWQGTRMRDGDRVFVCSVACRNQAGARLKHLLAPATPTSLLTGKEAPSLETFLRRVR